MSNFNLKLNLTTIGEFVELKDGRKAILIPADTKGVYVGEKGVYLNAVCVESSADFASHVVKIDKGDIIGNLSEFKAKAMNPKKIDF